MSEVQNDIELRSEKVRGVIGHIPNILVRIGIGVISLTVMCTLLILFTLPYPTYIEKVIYLYSEPNYFIEQASTNGTIHYDLINYTEQGDEISRIIQNSDTIISKSLIEGNVIFLCATNALVLKGTAICKITPPEVKNIFGIIYVPHSEIDYIYEEMPVDIFINSQKCIGYIEKIYPISDINDSHCIKVNIPIEYDKAAFVEQMTTTGQAKLLISNKPFLKRIIGL